jgi:hypothetical protein
MTGFDGKVRLCQLFERRSATTGRRYLTGRLGGAKIVALLDDRAELKFGATAAFTVFLEPGEDRPKSADAESAAGADRSHQRRQVQRWRREAAATDPPVDQPPAEERPFYDDPPNDLWRGDKS